MNRALTALFALTLFLAATLLFSAQPMIARMVLPVLGGSPAVWTTCMLFFQAELLAGYGYVHLATALLSVRKQLLLHLGWLLAAWACTPIGVPTGMSAQLATSGFPTASLLLLLVRSVGLPVFVVATTAPLLQRWF